MPPKPKSGQSNKDSVEALLSDLDSLGTAEASPRPSTSSSKAPTSTSTTPSGPKASASDDAQSLLDDLDNLVQRRAPTPRKQQQQQNQNPSQPTAEGQNASSPGDAAQAGVEPSPATLAAQALETTASPEQQQKPSDENSSSSASTQPAASSGGWGGWGTVWSSAAKLADQARAEIEKRAQSEQAREISQRGWGLTQGVRDFVKDAGLERLGEDITKVGKRGWTEVINAVAPPISAHEVIQVTLSHDMVGFDGVSDVTFKILARVMESQQVGRGTEQQLIVNKAPESKRPSTSAPVEPQTPMNVGKQDSADERDMRAVDGYDQGWKAAEASLSKLIASHEPEAPKASSVTVPVTNCPVFLRIQPVVAPLPGSTAKTAASETAKSTEQSTTSGGLEPKYVSFLLLLQDPSNGLSHRTCSQTFPHAWLSQSFDENPWIEQALVDVLEGALSVVGQDYINGRQSGRSRSIKPEEA